MNALAHRTWHRITNRGTICLWLCCIFHGCARTSEVGVGASKATLLDTFPSPLRLHIAYEPDSARRPVIDVFLVNTSDDAMAIPCWVEELDANDQTDALRVFRYKGDGTISSPPEPYGKSRLVGGLPGPRYAPSFFMSLSSVEFVIHEFHPFVLKPGDRMKIAVSRLGEEHDRGLPLWCTLCIPTRATDGEYGTALLLRSNVLGGENTIGCTGPSTLNGGN